MLEGVSACHRMARSMKEVDGHCDQPVEFASESDADDADDAVDAVDVASRCRNLLDVFRSSSADAWFSCAKTAGRRTSTQSAELIMI